MSREITVFSTSTSNLKRITTDAATWGALKPILKNEGIDPEGMKGMVKETEGTLENDGAQLPEGPFKLFLTPAKVKSGLN